MSSILTKSAKICVEQYSKSSLVEIAKAMNAHAMLIRQNERQHFTDVLLEQAILNDKTVYASDATVRLADSFEQIAYHLNFHVIPHI